jgi:predicted RNase H-like HicB family nuclease
MTLAFETQLETDGRWIAEVLELAGVMAYGTAEMEAIANVKALAARVIAERVQFGEHSPY